jgi:hypothetical protein
MHHGLQLRDFHSVIVIGHHAGQTTAGYDCIHHYLPQDRKRNASAPARMPTMAASTALTRVGKAGSGTRNQR